MRVFVPLVLFVSTLSIHSDIEGQQQPPGTFPRSELTSEEVQSDVKVIYNGKETRISFTMRKYLREGSATIYYTFYKPGTRQPWLLHRIYQTYERKEGENVRIHHKALLSLIKQAPSSALPRQEERLEDYNGDSPEESSEKFCNFLHKKFGLYFEQFWF